MVPLDDIVCHVGILLWHQGVQKIILWGYFLFDIYEYGALLPLGGMSRRDKGGM